MALLRVPPLPEDALEAAAAFHADVLPGVSDALSGQPDHLTLVFLPAGHTHRAWRLAAVQSLARDLAPVRVNAVAGDSEEAIAAALAYLAASPGVTGQYLPLDGNGAGAVL